MLLVPNAANTAEVVRRLAAAAPDGVKVTDHHDDYAVLAVQGTRSDEVLDKVGLPTGHDYMSFVEAELGDDRRRRRRVPHRLHRRARLRADRRQLRGRAGSGTTSWPPARSAGITACGLGSRDTLRTEMGYPLHGQDISLDTNPVEAGLSWAVGWKKDTFWGRDAVVQGQGGRARSVACAGSSPSVAASRDPAWASP